MNDRGTREQVAACTDRWRTGRCPAVCAVCARPRGQPTRRSGQRGARSRNQSARRGGERRRSGTWRGSGHQPARCSGERGAGSRTQSARRGGERRRPPAPSRVPFACCSETACWSIPASAAATTTWSGCSPWPRYRKRETGINPIRYRKLETGINHRYRKLDALDTGTGTALIPERRSRTPLYLRELLREVLRENPLLAPTRTRALQGRRAPRFLASTELWHPVD